LDNSLEQDKGKPTATILLVEDELNIAKLFNFNLTKAGFHCDVANNGKEGLKLAEKSDRI